MQNILSEWEKILWKKNQIENHDHDTKCANIKPATRCHCRTFQQQIWEWDDFVKKNWVEPVQERRDSLSESLSV